METTHRPPVRTAAYEVTIRFDFEYAHASDRSGCHDTESDFTDTVIVNARVHGDEEDTLAEAEYEALSQIKADRGIEKDSPYRSGTPGYTVQCTHKVLSIKKLAA